MMLLLPVPHDARMALATHGGFFSSFCECTAEDPELSDAQDLSPDAPRSLGDGTRRARGSKRLRKKRKKSKKSPVTSSEGDIAAEDVEAWINAADLANLKRAAEWIAKARERAGPGGADGEETEAALAAPSLVVTASFGSDLFVALVLCFVMTPAVLSLVVFCLGHLLQVVENWDKHQGFWYVPTFFGRHRDAHRSI